MWSRGPDGESLEGCDCVFGCVSVCFGGFLVVFLGRLETEAAAAALELSHQVGRSSIFDVLSPSQSSLDPESWLYDNISQ